VKCHSCEAAHPDPMSLCPLSLNQRGYVAPKLYIVLLTNLILIFRCCTLSRTTTPSAASVKMLDTLPFAILESVLEDLDRISNPGACVRLCLVSKALRHGVQAASGGYFCKTCIRQGFRLVRLLLLFVKGCPMLPIDRLDFGLASFDSLPATLDDPPLCKESDIFRFYGKRMATRRTIRYVGGNDETGATLSGSQRCSSRCA
jgi:hypothetical protein